MLESNTGKHSHLPSHLSLDHTSLPKEPSQTTDQPGSSVFVGCQFSAFDLCCPDYTCNSLLSTCLSHLTVNSIRAEAGSALFATCITWESWLQGTEIPTQAGLGKKGLFSAQVWNWLWTILDSGILNKSSRFDLSTVLGSTSFSSLHWLYFQAPHDAKWLPQLLPKMRSGRSKCLFLVTKAEFSELTLIGLA